MLIYKYRIVVLSVLTVARHSLASHTLHAGPFLSHSLVKVTVPAEEVSQELKHTKVDATINANVTTRL